MLFPIIRKPIRFMRLAMPWGIKGRTFCHRTSIMISAVSIIPQEKIDVRFEL